MSKRKPKETDGLEVTVSSDSANSRTIILGNAEEIKKRLDKIADLQPRREVIKKATIVDGRKLNVSYTEKTHSGIDTHTKKCSAPVHPDLLKAFLQLDNHLGRLCFQPLTEHNPAHKDNKELPSLICPIHCTGFSISGNEETESVILDGYRTLPNAKQISLESPSQKWNGDVFDYEQVDELSEAVMTCIGEVELYLFPSEEWPNCKTEPDNQLSLFPEEGEGEEGEEGAQNAE